jgi:anaerobic selenocysteine-containing dehydrogenase
VEKLKPGDRVWVKTPRGVAERKIGTIMATKKTRKGTRYFIEWEVDLVESPNHHPGYLETEIAPINLRGTN